MRPAYAVLLLLGMAAIPANGAMRGRTATLSGQWRVGPVVDTSHQSLPADLAAQLAHARLPLPGETVRNVSGKLCVGSLPCDEVTWTETTFADSQYGEGLKRTLGLSARTPIYEGQTSNRFIGYTLIGRPDHTLIALVTLCQDNDRATGCRGAYEIWHPTSRGARMTPNSPHR